MKKMFLLTSSIITFVILIGCIAVSKEKPLKKQVYIDISDIKISEDLKVENVFIEADAKSKNLGHLFMSIKNNSNENASIKVNFDTYDKNGKLIDTVSNYYGNLSNNEIITKQYPIYSLSKVHAISINQIENINLNSQIDNFNSQMENTLKVNFNIDKRPNSKKKNEHISIQCAKTLLFNNLKDTSTVEFLSANLLEGDKFSRFIVDVTLKAKNSHGAITDENYLVFIDSIEADGTFKYSKFATKMYENEKEKQDALKVIKNLNNWDKSR